jgi:hypothetical protein
MTENSAYCIQRNFRQLFPKPTTRLTFQSPYGQGYSEFDLSMRRKTEILKYNNPSTSGAKSNSLTRRERFSQVARGFSPQQKTVRNTTPEQLAFCDSSMNITLSNKANIPGPAIPLYLDKSVPLYMFSQPDRNFNDNADANENVFEFYVTSNELLNESGTTITFEENVRTQLGVLHIIRNDFESVLSLVLKLVVDSVSIPKLQVSVNGSLIQQTTNYQYTISSANDSGTYDLTISNILIPTEQPYYFVFSLLFGSKIIVDSSTVIMNRI